MHIRRYSMIILLLSILSLLSSCGQKGPLYLPTDSPQKQSNHD